MESTKWNWKILAQTLVLLVLMAGPVLAVDMGDISSSDRQAFNEILQPVMKIYNLIKYTATVVACIMGVFAGVTYITSGSDPRKRETAKQMAMYILIGLAIIWAAPLIVNFVID